MPSAPGQTVAEPAGFVPFDLSETEQSISARFERVATIWPDRLAIGFGDARWTYRTLKAAADRIALAVGRARGAPPQPVAILVGQGPALLASLLGVLKAGHFYVPLDARLPIAALGHIVKDVGASLILTDGLRCAFAAALGSPTIDVEALLRGPEPTREPPSAHVGPDALACVYYTSGSTGGPKGVADTHRNVLHNVLRYTNGLKICADDRLSLVQSPTFSGVMSSQFGALLNGAAVFPFDIPAEGIARLGPWMIDEGITIYHSVPAIFRHMLRAGREDQIYADVRVVRLEGDGATLTDVMLFRQHFTDRAVIAHGLGATECGLVRRFFLSRDTALDEGIVPIGYPVEDMTVRILDDRGSALGDGEVGEITVESRYLSPGYWMRPDLTAAVFGEGLTPGTRRYRTGDLGRIRSDGCLEHLGRKDDQPKVRGQRVDVAAIEAALMDTRLIREAVVQVRASVEGDARLIAYLVPLKTRALNVTTVRRRLRSVLPARSLPSRFVVLDALPVTSSHKIDRRALPAPDRARPQLDVPFLAARSDLEAAIASAWAATLDLNQVGVADDFFDLGGDSLAAAAMHARVSRHLDRELPAFSVFELPTVEQFSKAVDAFLRGRDDRPATAPSPRSALVRVQTSGSRPPFFFLHAEYGGDGFYCLNVARHLGADQPFFGLCPFGRDGEPVPCTIEAMAAEYLTIVRKEQPDGPYVLGGFCSCAVVAWEMARQLRQAGADVALLVLIEPAGTESGLVARALHFVGAIAGRLGAGDEARVRFLQRAIGLARLRWLPVKFSSLRAAFRAIRTSVRTETPPDQDRRLTIAATYSRAVQAYLPRPYDGPVLCLQASEREGNDCPDQWRRLAADFTARRIPGDHNSCIITHSRSLGLALASHLSVVPRPPDSASHPRRSPMMTSQIRQDQLDRQWVDPANADAAV